MKAASVWVPHFCVKIFEEVKKWIAGRKKVVYNHF